MVTQAKWVERIREWKESGLCAEEFCRDRPFTVKSMQAAASRLASGAVDECRSPEDMGRIVRVTVAGSRSAGQPMEGVRHSLQDAEVVLEVAGARVAVGAGCCPQTLAMVVGVLRGGRP